MCEIGYPRVRSACPGFGRYTPGIDRIRILLLSHIIINFIFTGKIHSRNNKGSMQP